MNGNGNGNGNEIGDAEWKNERERELSKCEKMDRAHIDKEFKWLIKIDGNARQIKRS